MYRIGWMVLWYLSVFYISSITHRGVWHKDTLTCKLKVPGNKSPGTYSRKIGWSFLQLAAKYTCVILEPPQGHYVADLWFTTGTWCTQVHHELISENTHLHYWLCVWALPAGVYKLSRLQQRTENRETARRKRTSSLFCIPFFGQQLHFLFPSSLQTNQQVSLSQRSDYFTLLMEGQEGNSRSC